MKIPFDYHRNQPSQWVYYPPKWYHFRYRGGKFVMYYNHRHRDSQMKLLDQPLEFVASLLTEKRADYHMKTVSKSEYVGSSRYDVTVLRFKDKADVVQFKLKCM